MTSPKVNIPRKSPEYLWPQDIAVPVGEWAWYYVEKKEVVVVHRIRTIRGPVSTQMKIPMKRILYLLDLQTKGKSK